MHLKPNRQALRVALIYVGVAGGWVLLSDKLVVALVPQAEQRLTVSILKGLSFVALTGIFLFLGIRRLLRDWERLARQRQSDAAEHARARTHYQNLLETATDGIHVLNQAGCLMEANATFYHMLGYSPLPPPSLKVSDWDVNWSPAQLQERMQKPELFETIHRRRDGRLIQVEVNARRIDIDGQPCLYASSRDITRRKEAEASLRESEERYRQLFELESDAVVLVDIATQRLVDVNPSAQNLYGYTRAEFLELTADALSAGSVETGAAADQCAGFATLRWHRKKTGERFAVEINTNTISYPGRKLALTTIRDVTSRHQTMQMLRETTAQLVEAQHLAGLGSYVFDVPTGSWSGSEVLGELFGLADPGRPRDVIEWLDVVHPQDRTAMQIYLQDEVLRHRSPFDRVYRIVRATDGQERWVHGLGKLILNEQDIPVRLVGVIQDITERKEVEQRMQQAQKMEAIGTLAGGVAHDFNNILASMFGYAYLLQQDTQDSPAAQESIGEILKAATRAKELVQQILTFSRQRERKPEVIHPAVVVKEAIKFLRASLPAQIEIELNLSADTPAVLADPTQVYQVVINLATNALHAMENRPGKLAIALTKFEPDPLFLRSHPEAQPARYAQLTVADTGHGMDAHTMERIFEPFFTTKPVGKGTGLGLAVVHGIVQAHNGFIAVSSEPGRGTTFRLYFPEGRVPAAPAVPEAAMPMGAGEKILLVDDEVALAQALQGMLSRLNYQVTTCNAARDALRRFQQAPVPFDLVITDLTMPEMTGIEIAQQIRHWQPAVPIILASGFSAELNQEKLRAAGISELLEKPVSQLRLAQAIRRALPPLP